MTLSQYLASAAWRSSPPPPAKVRGSVDVDRIAAELHDLGRSDLARALPADEHPDDALRWAWEALREA